MLLSLISIISDMTYDLINNTHGIKKGTFSKIKENGQTSKISRNAYLLLGD